MIRTVLITGGTDGIGKATAILLAKLPGYEIIIHGRNAEKCQKVASEISDVTKNPKINYVIADLSRLKTVVEMCSEVKTRFPNLNILMLNAGVKSWDRVVTPDGMEQNFQVNHMGYFTVAHHLIDLLKSNARSRIVVVSSCVYDWIPLDWENLESEKGYEMDAAYSTSKTLNHLFALKLARDLSGSGVTCNVLEPGVIDTKLLNTGYESRGGAPIAEGIKTTTKLCSDPDLDEISGKYFNTDGNIIEVNETVSNFENQNKLWKLSEDILRKMDLL